MDIKKILKNLPTGFADEAAGMSDDGLRQAILQSEVNIAEVERTQKQDDKLNGAKEIVKDLSGGYNDAKKAQRAKIAYCLHVLDERGKAPAADES